MVTIILALASMVAACVQYLLGVKERKANEKREILANRINELRKIEKIEFAREAKEFETELLKIESKLNSYPNATSFINLVLIFVAIATFISALSEFKS